MSETAHGFSGREAASLALGGAKPAELRKILGMYASMDEYLGEGEVGHLLAGVGHYEPQGCEWGSDIWVMVLGGEGYPEQLARSPHPPVLLYGRGDPGALSSGVAVVGTREMSKLGSSVARAAVAGAVACGAVVDSGLALGVDGEAHRATLEAGGVTVAVLGCGVDQPTPRSHRGLSEAILGGGGALVAEVPPGQEVAGWSLMARNRIIIGLASCVVVCESGLKSGTMGAVAAAVEAGRAIIVAEPKPAARGLAGAAGLLALADGAGVDPSEMGWKGSVAKRMEAKRPIADFVAHGSDELKSLVGTTFRRFENR